MDYSAATDYFVGLHTDRYNSIKFHRDFRRHGIISIASYRVTRNCVRTAASPISFYLLLTNDRAASKLRDIIKYDNTGVVLHGTTYVIAECFATAVAAFRNCIVIVSA